MKKFIFAHEPISASGLFVALALIVVSGCASVHERDFGRQGELQALDPAAVDGKPVQPGCPLRHMYVCERQFRTHPVTCYCTPEPATLPPGPEGLRRVF